MSTDGSNAAKRRREGILKVFDRFGDLVSLNICFVLGCLPIFTIGTSLTATFYVTNQLVRGKFGSIRKDYWKSFKLNFKQTTIIWIGIMVILYLMYIGAQYARITTGAIHTVIVGVFIAVMVILLFMTPFLFPLISRYNNTTGKMLGNTLILSVKNLGLWLKVFLLWVAPIGVYLVNAKIFVYTWVFWLVFLVAFLAYLTSMLLKPLFDDLEEEMGLNTEEENADE